MKPLIILGCGYLGSRLARAALAAGRPVRVGARSTGKLAALGALGAEVKYVNASQPKTLGPAMHGLPGATVVWAIPPVTDLPPGHAIRGALQAAHGGRCDTFVYFGSTGLYGDRPDDDAWIDEDTPLDQGDPPMQGYHHDETAIAACPFDDLRTVILRLAPVYGPGRGMRAQLGKGKYTMLEDGRHATSRVHVDDIATVVFAAEERAPMRATYLVADDEPTTQRTYAEWLCERMGLPLPGSRELYEANGRRNAHRNRKIRNQRMKDALGVALRYPSFREGEAAIEAEDAAATAG